MGREFSITQRIAAKDGMYSQYAALCYRVEGGDLKVLLITSRGTGRWIIPKGWPIAGLSPSETAAQEAWEEAGVQGKLSKHKAGFYSYDKLMGSGELRPCFLTVFPIEVKKMADDYPEQGQRRRKWYSPKKAAARVDEPELAKLLREFDPRKLK